MLYYYAVKAEDGSIVAVGAVEEPGQIPTGAEQCAKEVRDAWLAQKRAEQQAKEEALAAMPSSEEQLRADIDYLAALQGVSL